MVLSKNALQARRDYMRNYMRQYRAANKEQIKANNEKSAEKYWERKAKEKEQDLRVQAQRQIKADISMFELAGYYSSDNK